MKTLELIRDNKDWKEILTNAPYNLKLKEKDDLVLLKYDMLESDMSNPIVQECRGVIIDVAEMRVVCRPFDKFFNAGEVHAAALKGKIRAEEKVDGSIIKVFFYKGEWRVATNGMIDANDAELILPVDGIRTYRDLFNVAFEKYLKLDTLNSLVTQNYTLIFELVSPANRIVIAYPETDLRLLGIRGNNTGCEIDPRTTNLEKIFKTPRIYDIDTLDQALKVAKTLGIHEEGFVLVDEHFNRVKVKGAEYLAMHKIRSNDFSLKGFLVTVLNNSQDDLVAYFPEYIPYIQDIEGRIKAYKEMVYAEIAKAPWGADKKSFALVVKDSPAAAILFKLYNNKDYDWKGVAFSIDNLNKLVQLLGLKGE